MGKGDLELKRNKELRVDERGVKRNCIREKASRPGRAFLLSIFYLSKRWGGRKKGGLRRMAELECHLNCNITLPDNLPWTITVIAALWQLKVTELISAPIL